MEGSGKVVSKFDELSDTADVQVVIGKGERLMKKSTKGGSLHK